MYFAKPRPSFANAFRACRLMPEKNRMRVDEVFFVRPRADQAAAMRSISFRVTFVLFSMAPSGRNSQWLWKLSPPVK